MVYPSISPIIPMIIPTFSISFCWIMPVACAKALGGVLIGNIIANDEPIATPINKVLHLPAKTGSHAYCFPQWQEWERAMRQSPCVR